MNLKGGWDEYTGRWTGRLKRIGIGTWLRARRYSRKMTDFSCRMEDKVSRKKGQKK
jgi:hypothetical protein